MERASTIQLPSGLLFLLPLFIVIFAYIRWEDVVIQHPDGTLSIDDEIADKVADRLDRIHNRTVLYKLVAASNGYFACPLCPPETTKGGRYFLNYREVYKYGITIAAEKRYSISELARWNLRYEQIAVGNYDEMLLLETTYMGEYPLHPENLKRPINRRLVTPPGSGTRLR